MEITRISFSLYEHVARWFIEHIGKCAYHSLTWRPFASVGRLRVFDHVLGKSSSGFTAHTWRYLEYVVITLFVVATLFVVVTLFVLCRVPAHMKSLKMEHSSLGQRVSSAPFSFVRSTVSLHHAVAAWWHPQIINLLAPELFFFNFSTPCI